MKLALVVSMLMTSLALNAHTLQGKVVRVADGDTITILDEAKRVGLWAYGCDDFGCHFKMEVR